jgi:hypothetical protein
MTTEELRQLLDDGIHDRFAVDVRQFLDCEFFMFHSVMVEHVLPGYGTASLDRRSPTFRRVVLSSSRVDIYKHLKEKHYGSGSPGVLRGSPEIRDHFLGDSWIHFCNGYFEFGSCSICSRSFNWPCYFAWPLEYLIKKPPDFKLSTCSECCTFPSG